MSNALIVEDNASFRQMLKRMLLKEFPAMTIREASDGREALTQIENQPPEIIFMDIRLPGENGIELTRKIQASHPKTIVLVISNCDTVEYREAAFEAGATAFLSKASSSPMHIIKTVSEFFPADGAASAGF